MLIEILFLISVIGPSWSRMSDEVAAYSSTNNNCSISDRCFHQPIEACPSPESKCRCRVLPHCKSTAVCCNVNKSQLNEGLICANITGNSNIEAIHIRNAVMDTLNLEEWKRVKYLRYMSITDGNITNVSGEFVKQTGISCLNLSSNSIDNFENRSLVNLYNLSFLDLSHNNLLDVPRFKKDGNINLDISGNKRMICNNIYDALARTLKDINFINENNTFCNSATTFQWFNSTNRISLSEVIKIHELSKDCNKNCTCAPDRLIEMKNTNKWLVSMNCTDLKLTTMPSLPPNTYFLNVSNNNITSLEPLHTDPTYRHLVILIADNNQITSVLPLEGSHFMNNILVLSLRNNKFKTLPTYIFSKAVSRNEFRVQVKLGQNRLRCDCNTAKSLQDLLNTEKKTILDYDEIYCDNIDVQIIELKQAKVCQIKQDWTDYIYYIITAEILLLIGLIAKVVYDYCVFKSFGYLPWPASKMPKLPCDWLCE